MSSKKKVEKKSEKKVGVKKPKTVVKKISKPKVLSPCTPEKAFILFDGRVVKSVKELADILEKDEGAFLHHVTSDRNDFSDWIEHVFLSKKLGEKIRGLDNALNVRVEIYKFLVESI
jgi:hypothetical protein